MNRPLPGEYAEYYHKYINQVTGENIVDILTSQLNEVEIFLESISEEKSFYKYAEGKWSIKEVLGHIIDCERIFAYRMLRFSRNDSENALPGFEENSYIKNSNYSNMKFASLIEEFIFLRKSTLLMIKGFSGDVWTRRGIASNNNVTVRAIAYIIAGHAQHHISVIKERYF
jgi:hypothetical protein